MPDDWQIYEVELAPPVIWVRAQSFEAAQEAVLTRDLDAAIVTCTIRPEAITAATRYPSMIDIDLMPKEEDPS
jgi:hypothetical protein